MTEDQKLKDLLATRPKIVALDLDGTVAEYSGWKGYFEIGAPRPRVVEVVKWLKDQGAYIIVHSSRVTTADNKVYLEAVEYMKGWLLAHKVPFDEIWMGTGKPGADIYLDDRAKNPDCETCMASLRI